MPPTRSLFLPLWLAGLLGIVALAWLVVPALAGRLPAEAPPVWVIQLASAAQSAVLLALAVWAGARLAPGLGLAAPVFAARCAGEPMWPVLRRQLPAALAGGIAGALILMAFAAFAPAALRQEAPMPLAARVLYGGITEELLLRWGLMTFALWALWGAWRRLRRITAMPAPAAIWLAIAVSALAFALGHLPAAWALAGPLPAETVAWILGANAVFGLIAGYLFWRRGLEAAMMAHGLAHLIAAATGH